MYKLEELEIDYLNEINEDMENLMNTILAIENRENKENNLRLFKQKIHSVKGSACSYDFNAISAVCHTLEDHFERMEKHGMTRNFYDKILSCLDLIKKYIRCYLEGKKIKNNELSQNIISLSVTNESVGYKVLVVDSSRAMSSFISSVLENKGILVSTCKSPMAALSRILDEEFDAVISSNQIGDLTGISLIRMIRAGNLDKNGLKCILITSDENKVIYDSFVPDKVILKNSSLEKNIIEYFRSVLSEQSYRHTKKKFIPRSILFIDDDKNIHTILKVALKNVGFDIEYDFCFGVSDSREKLKSFHYDLIVSDFNLSNETGEDIRILLNNLEIKTPLVFFTGETKSDELKKLYNYGPIAVLSKPIRPSNFFNRLMEEIELARENICQNDKLMNDDKIA